jgi:hypothetical protein
VTNAKLQENLVKFSNVASDNFAVNSVTPAKIADGSVGPGPTSDQAGVSFQSNQLGPAFLVGQAITEATLLENGVGGDVFAENIFDASRITAGAASGSAFADGSVTTAKVKDATVAAQSLSAGALTDAAKFGASAVTKTDLRVQAITQAQFADGAIKWKNTQTSVFEQAQEAVKLIDMVQQTVNAIDQKCRTPGANSLKHKTHTLAINQGKSMEEHHAFCARRGLGKAVKVQNHLPHQYHTRSQKRLLMNSAVSTSSSFALVTVLFAALFLC